MDTDERAEYLWFLERGFRWPKTYEERGEIYPTRECEIQQRGKELSEENRAEARYEATRRKALFEMALPELERISAERDARFDALEAGE